MKNKPVIRIGSRGSPLALWQAHWVAGRLAERYPEADVPITVITTSGDRFAGQFTQSASDKGMFVKEIEEALLRQEIDLAVHSMKDLPTDLPPGLAVSVIPEREESRDALVARQGGTTLETLPEGAGIGTGSPRRAAQLVYFRPDLKVVPIRGNVDTRLRKLHEENLEAIILAAAGLRRLGLETRISQLVPVTVILPAVGQGALGLETRESDDATHSLTEFLHHPPTAACVGAERSFLKALGGGCHVPIAAHATTDGRTISLQGCVADGSGRRVIRGSLEGALDQSFELGRQLAEALCRQGAGTLLGWDQDV